MCLLEGFCVFLNACLLLHKFLNLVSGEFACVRVNSAVGHSIEGVLRILLMEDVLLAILPVGEVGGVTAAVLNGLFHLEDLRVLLLGPLAKRSIVDGLRLRNQLHLVGVNDFGLLFRVERHLVIPDV
jgi:hypothetical protein